MRDVVCVRLGCRYFIYGQDGARADLSRRCYWEQTEKKTCLEGWEDDSYNFYFANAGWLEYSLAVAIP